VADEEALAVADNIPLFSCGEMSAVHLLRVHRTTQTRLDLKLALVVYIGWYNQRRPHRALKRRTPLEVLNQYIQEAAKRTVASK
jgi:transposase InsO family protein